MDGEQRTATIHVYTVYHALTSLIHLFPSFLPSSFLLSSSSFFVVIKGFSDDALQGFMAVCFTPTASQRYRQTMLTHACTDMYFTSSQVGSGGRRDQRNKRDKRWELGILIGSRESAHGTYCAAIAPTLQGSVVEHFTDHALALSPPTPFLSLSPSLIRPLSLSLSLSLSHSLLVFLDQSRVGSDTRWGRAPPCPLHNDTPPPRQPPPAINDEPGHAVRT